MSEDLSRLDQQVTHLTYEVERLKKAGLTQSAELNELFGALSKAQGEIQIASLNRQNPYFKSKYADMASIVGVSREPLAKNGLCIIQQIQANGDLGYLITKLGHSSGQWIESRMKIQPPKNDVQSLGSYLTYIKRYAYAAIVGIATGDDDDAELAMGRASFQSDHLSGENLLVIEKLLKNDPDLKMNILRRKKVTDLSELPASCFSNLKAHIEEVLANREKEETIS